MVTLAGNCSMFITTNVLHALRSVGREDELCNRAATVVCSGSSQFRASHDGRCGKRCRLEGSVSQFEVSHPRIWNRVLMNPFGVTTDGSENHSESKPGNKEKPVQSATRTIHFKLHDDDDEMETGSAAHLRQDPDSQRGSYIIRPRRLHFFIPEAHSREHGVTGPTV